MKTMLHILSIGLLIQSCNANNEHNTTVPENIKTKVEALINEKEANFDRKFEEYVGIEWGSNVVKSGDSAIYPFFVIFERDGNTYPFEHRVIVKADTIADIEKLTVVNELWLSILPTPFNVKDQSWWREITSSENIESIYALEKKLELIDSTENIWSEVFRKNVILVFNSGDTLWADTLIWCPQLDKISIKSMTIVTHKNGIKTTLSGGSLESNSDFTEYEINSLVHTQYQKP